MLGRVLHFFRFGTVLPQDLHDAHCEQCLPVLNATVFHTYSTGCPDNAGEGDDNPVTSMGTIRYKQVVRRLENASAAPTCC